MTVFRADARFHGDIGGGHPVQGEGVIDGFLWYYRARHGVWSVDISADDKCLLSVELDLTDSAEPEIDEASAHLRAVGRFFRSVTGKQICGILPEDAGDLWRAVKDALPACTDPVALTELARSDVGEDEVLCALLREHGVHPHEQAPFLYDAWAYSDRWRQNRELQVRLVQRLRRFAAERLPDPLTSEQRAAAIPVLVSACLAGVCPR
ncbi:MAG: hypothetical protein AAFX94_17870 [Myxococcota bacterium]